VLGGGEERRPGYDEEIDDWDDSNAVQKTRFTKHQIRVLVVALKIDATEWSYGIRPDATMALVATLCRLSWPRPPADLVGMFGYCGSCLSRVVNDACQHLIKQHQERTLWHPRFQQYKVLRAYARAMINCGCPGRIWGFIDVPFTSFSRPVSRQHMFYSGHKRLHGMVFQAITTPDGLISSVFGPFIRGINDWGMFNASRVPHRLHRMIPVSNKMLYLYGDPAYHCSYGLICPFGPRKQLSRRKRRFNKELSAHRIAVLTSSRSLVRVLKI
jgi:hypothetical protein